MGDWFYSVFAKKLIGTPWYAWAVVLLLIALFCVLMVSGRRGKWDTKRIAYASVCLAISFVLSCMRLYKMPNGGSITLASMLPLVMFSLACGPAQGAMAGCAYGFLQLIQDSSSVIHPLQLLIDYPMAFAAIGLAGFASRLPIHKSMKLPMAVLFAAIGRYAMAVLSGVVFFAEYAPAGQPVLAYSTLYNLTYLGPDTLFCMAVAFVPGIARIVDVIAGESRLSVGK